MVDYDVVAVGAGWFLSSALLSTFANTAFLQHFESPYLLTLVRFIGSAVIGLVANALDSSPQQLRRAHLRTVWPAFAPSAALLLAANYANSVSLQLSGITLTYVVKSAIPVATVATSAMQGTWFNGIVYASIVPTVVGVALAAWSDLDFTPLGFAAAVTSMVCQTMLNLASKKALQETKLGGVKAQFVMVSIASVLLCMPAAYDLARGGLGELHAAALELDVIDWRTMALAAFAYHSEYALNFVFSAKVDSLAFSIADIARRLSIIAVGSVLFNKPLSLLNMVGIAVCFIGVLSYSLVDKRPIKSAAKST